MDDQRQATMIRMAMAMIIYKGYHIYIGFDRCLAIYKDDGRASSTGWAMAIYKDEGRGVPPA